jgi:hypothetical protein
MISREERNYNNQVALFNSLYQREVLDGSLTKDFYIPLFKEHGVEITKCYNVARAQVAKPEYHEGFVETIYKSMMRIHGMEFSVEADHYWNLDALESASELYKK